MESLVTKGLALSSKRNDPRLSRKYKEVRLRKLAEDGWTCYYCGYEGKDMTIDHIIPVSKAPELAIEISNMVSCCKPCNSKKGNRSQGVFLDTLRTPPCLFCLSVPDAVQVAPRQSLYRPTSPELTRWQPSAPNRYEGQPNQGFPPYLSRVQIKYRTSKTSVR